MDKSEIPIWKKANLTIKEASEYSNIGQNKIRTMIEDPMCDFVLHVGCGKSLIKRKKFEEYLEKTYEI